MTTERLRRERDRFNTLLPETALAILNAAEGQQPDFRSCWYCNAAHEHLKNREVLFCFACHSYYLQGYPAPVVVKRSRGEAITDDDMKSLNDILKESL